MGNEAEELLARPSVIALADRMLSLAPWVSEQIHGESAAPWKTMVHGMSLVLTSNLGPVRTAIACTWPLFPIV